MQARHFDFAVDDWDDGRGLQRVEVKTATFLPKGRREVSVATRAGNQS